VGEDINHKPSAAEHLAIEPAIVAKVEQLAPVNDLVSEIVSVSQIAKNETQGTLSLASETQRQNDDDEAIALIMILAEID
jgi:hypothetical protein